MTCYTPVINLTRGSKENHGVLVGIGESLPRQRSRVGGHLTSTTTTVLLMCEYHEFSVIRSILCRYFDSTRSTDKYSILQRQVVELLA